MKICEKQKTKKIRKSIYEDLKTGDVFMWTDDDCSVLRTDKGYTYLINPYVGHHYAGENSRRSPITFYPNACITLGDPE